MPYYGPQYEKIDGGDGAMFEEYNFGVAVTEEFQSSTGSEISPVGFNVTLYDIPEEFNQVIKFGEKGYVKIVGGDEYDYNWGTGEDPATRIVYINQEIGEKDETGVDKWVELTIEALGADEFGKPHWASQPSDYYPVTDPLGSIVETETFTITLTEFLPKVLGPAPHIDEDIRVILKNSNGTEVECNKDNLSNNSITCTYPDTVKIKVRGNYTKWLFPYDTWEYYFEKDQEYTPNPDHEPFLLDSEENRTYDESVKGVPVSTLMNAEESASLSVIDFGDVPSSQDVTMLSGEAGETASTVGLPNYPGRIASTKTTKALPFDPNDFVDAYRITQEYKSGTGPFGVIKDLSVEVPLNVNILQYYQDPQTDIDVLYKFSVTSVVTGGPLEVEYAVGNSLVANSIVTIGEDSYLVLVGGFILIDDPPPAGSTYYTDANNIEFQYRPTMLGDSFGGGTFQVRHNVINDYVLGLEKYEQVLDERGLRRIRE
jgi:hypothetical protein